METANWKNVIENDVRQISTQYNLDKLNLKFSEKKYRIGSWLLSFLGIILLIIGCWMLFTARFEKSSIKPISIVILILGIIMLITGLTLHFLQQRIMKVQGKIIAKLNLSNYYSLAISQLTNDKYKLANLKKSFDLPPHNFLPTSGKSQTDNVLNIIGKETKFSFGTITNEIVYETTNSDGRTHKKRVYTRYRYLTTTLLKENELIATIQKSKSFLKIFKSKDNTDLESTEFEKIFAVVANDQVLIRKLLVPKVLANLVDKANNEKTIPAIEFNKQNLTLHSDTFPVNDWRDPKGTIAGIDFLISKDKNLSESLSEKIIDDINMFLECLSWVETYEVI